MLVATVYGRFALISKLLTSGADRLVAPTLKDVFFKMYRRDSGGEGEQVMPESTTRVIARKTWEAKRKALDMCIRAQMGHLSSAYSCAEIVATLYYGIMRHNPQNPNWRERDRFIMSKNHGSLILYPILADMGYFSECELTTFLQNETRLGTHSKLTVEGIDFAGGSLGIGLGVGSGLAYAAKMERENWRTFVLVGDGECHEGSVWEAAMFAAHNQLDNLVVVIDRNRLCVTDFTEKILRLEPLADKWRAFGWDAIEVDGHNIEQLLTSLTHRHTQTGEKPLAIIANTTKGNGIDFMSNAPLFHGVAPSGEDIDKAITLIEGARI